MTTLNQTWTAADDLKLRQEAEESLRWETEHALAEYHMSQDMSAMAARIDQLLAENDRLQRALTKEST